MTIDSLSFVSYTLSNCDVKFFSIIKKKKTNKNDPLWHHDDHDQEKSLATSVYACLEDIQARNTRVPR